MKKYYNKKSLDSYIEYSTIMTTSILSFQNKETLKAIEKYCEENNIIPNLIEKEKLDLILKLGINQYNSEIENKKLKEIIKEVYDILNNQFEAYLEPQDTLLIQKCKDLLKEVL